MLPLSGGLPGGGYTASSFSASFGALQAPSSHALGRYIRRGLTASQWDLDYTFYQLIYAFRSPAKVYKLTQHRKQTKNQWARDDPAFAILLLGFLSAAAVAYGIAYEMTSPLSYLWLVAHAWGHFIVTGLLICTANWFLANHYLRGGASGAGLHASLDQEVEWLYAWDVHCNAFVPVLLLGYVGMYVLLPLTAGDGFFSALVANTLAAAAAVHYWYVTFSGFLVLPFLGRQNLFLLPVVGVGLLYLSACLVGWNVPRALLGVYVG